MVHRVLRFDDVYMYKDVNKCRPNPGMSMILYSLLKERKSIENISHIKMPSYEDHIEFIYTRPYMYWFLIWSDMHSKYIGGCYISYKNEIGITISISHRGEGYGKLALNYLLNLEGPTRGPYFANINPANESSISLFQEAGFLHIQNTYKLG